LWHDRRDGSIESFSARRRDQALRRGDLLLCEGGADCAQPPWSSVDRV